MAVLALAFFFRLGYGLCLRFWADDEKQIYLLGLKFYTTGLWPYFGPDVDVLPGGASLVQIPGALQGLLVGLPFYILPTPEAPFLLLNLISFSSLCLLAWYCTRRLPGMPGWFIWAWLLTAPWTLNFSTHVTNPSYVLAGGIIFFVGALETYPHLSRRLIPPRWANLMMGAALVWVMQLHLSWFVLLPYAAASFYLQIRAEGRRGFRAVGWFMCGALLVGGLLLPTYLKYGFRAGLGRTGSMIGFNAANLLSIPNIIEGIPGRFLSFASFELARFTGGHTADRLAFFSRHPLLAPFALFVGLVGILQPLLMLVLWFLPKRGQEDWRAIKYLTLSTVCLLYLSFLFAKKEPASHTFYVVLPLAMIYSFYCWNDFLKRRGWQVFAAFFIACGIIFHMGLAFDRYATESLYVNRGLCQSAIAARDYLILGARREGARY